MSKSFANVTVMNRCAYGMSICSAMMCMMMGQRFLPVCAVTA